MSGSAEPVWTEARPVVALRGQISAALVRARVDLVLWAPMALACGIGGYFLLRDEPSAVLVWAMVGALCVGLAGLFRAPEALRFPAGLLALCALGFVLAEMRAHSVAAPVLSFRYYGPVEGRIVGIDRSARDRIRVTLDQLDLDNVAPSRTPGRVRVSLQEEPRHLLLEPGLRVMLTANLSPPNGPTEPGAWDFRRMAWFQGLGAVGYTRAPVMLLEPAEPGDLALAGHRMRMAISRAMQARMEGQAGAVAAALMTGDRSGISEATNEVMRASNLYHIVSISGLHMGMLAGFVFAAIRYGIAACGSLALRVPAKKVAALVALMAATGYLWVAGAEVATARAYLMTAVMLLAVLFDRRALSLRTVALAAIVLMVLRPESVTEPGFQMSFAATVGLIALYSHWESHATGVPRWLRPVLGLLVTSLIASAATGPLSAAHFNRVSGYGVIANMLTVPVMGTFIMSAGVVAAVLAPIGLSGLPLWVMEMGTRWMIFIAEWVAGMGGAVSMVPSPPAVVVPLMTAGAMVALLARGPVRAAGICAALVAMALWMQVTRPVLLVGAEAELVGLMTPAGRALSKPGAAYVAENWLEADGDGATAEEAAARPAFAGPKGVRTADWNGRAVVHLTGKAAPERVAETCRDGALLIVAARLAEGATGKCEIWDQVRLQRSGALAFDASGALRKAETGHRLWD
ncbi:ComEC/Rec2 family competence protein [Paenirhodobacter sp.]|uniref:ComEC/Rec2 family competence protein n=1 Tax=Paenirhodobacter sp. TaxID=1965326 RepID=UPI003B3CA10B